MNRKANSLVVVIIIVVVLGIIGFMGFRVMNKNPNSSIVPTQVPNIGDIDRSGVADESDRMMIRGQLGCIKDQPCWDKVVGKTKDGDNPIYTFDLDLDTDNAISQKDIDLVK